MTWLYRVAITWFGFVGDSREIAIDAALVVIVFDLRSGPNDMWHPTVRTAGLGRTLL
jgi:RNase adaptor protein for sRNA GlmZ degradation